MLHITGTVDTPHEGLILCASTSCFPPLAPFRALLYLLHIPALPLLDIRHHDTSIFRSPRRVPRPGEKLVHTLDGHLLRLRRHQTQQHEAHCTYTPPEQERTPHIQGSKHDRRRVHDRKLEKPPERRKSGVADVTVARGEDLGAVDVLDRAQADGPAGRIDEHREDGDIGAWHAMLGLQEESV